MATMATQKMVHTAAEALLPDGRVDYDRLITSDDKPVDSVYSEKQMRLLTAPLYACWPGPGEGRPFFALANVGLFYAYREPPVVPDVMLGTDVALDPKFKSYFVWEYGNPPDATVEIVSGKDGEELGRKKKIYQRIGIRYYVVWDPGLFLGDQALTCFMLRGKKFETNGDWFPELGLGVKVWHGVHENVEADWLRWCDQKGVLIPTAEEKIAREHQRAEKEKQRADLLAEKLRALGVDPEKP